MCHKSTWLQCKTCLNNNVRSTSCKTLHDCESRAIWEEKIVSTPVTHTKADPETQSFMPHVGLLFIALSPNIHG